MATTAPTRTVAPPRARMTAGERRGARLAGVSLLTLTLLAIPAASLLEQADDAATPWAVGLLFLVVAGLDVATAWGTYAVTRRRAGTVAYAAFLARAGYGVLLAAAAVVLLWPGGQAAGGFRQDWAAALVVFGISLVVTGVALWRSRIAPRIVAALTLGAGAAYLLDDVLARWSEVTWRPLLVPLMLGELALLAWLLRTGMRRRSH